MLLGTASASGPVTLWSLKETTDLRGVAAIPGQVIELDPLTVVCGDGRGVVISSWEGPRLRRDEVLS